jgi:REP element-mobilizing transposase RayT
MAVYRGFARRLRHEVPGWVESGALFHIRISIDQSQATQFLTEPNIAGRIMRSVTLYEDQRRWHATVFLLMPDHLHALLSFAPDFTMSRIVGDWKGFHARKNGIHWQEGFFDHRLRNDERREQLEMKCAYIRRNPVVAGLCRAAEDWPWVYPAQIGE